MLDRILLERKVQQLAHYVEQLRRFAHLGLQEFTQDIEKRYAVERVMQLIVDEAIDINGYVILASRQAPPKDYYGSFFQMAALGVYPRSLAVRLAPTTALRNALGHEYEEVDEREVYRNISLFLSLYPRYVRQVLAFTSRRTHKE